MIIKIVYAKKIIDRLDANDIIAKLSKKFKSLGIAIK